MTIMVRCVTSNKAIPSNPSQTVQLMGPNIQMYEPVGLILIQTTTPHSPRSGIWPLLLLPLFPLFQPKQQRSSCVPH